MTEHWWVLDAGVGDYDFNMALDEALVEAMPRLLRPVLRFYGWTQPAASFGYFQHYRDIEQFTNLRPLVRRPTGGGLVPHDHDWTYSVAVPTSNKWYSLSARDSYCRAHTWLQTAFAQLDVPTSLAAAPRRPAAGQCFVGYEESDLLWRGKKIAGAAQRRRKDGLLIQGSVQPPSPALRRSEWQRAMTKPAALERSVTWESLRLDCALLERAAALVRAKYSQASYNQRR